MARLFDITTTADSLTLEAGGSGKLVFTVTNATQKPQRSSLRARALDSGQAAWLAIAGEAERDFPAGFTHQVELAVKVPAGTPPGKFRVRIDALSVTNPDDDFTEGPAVNVVVAAASAPPPKPSMGWVWLVAGLVVLIIAGVIAFLVLRKPDHGVPVPPPAPSEPASRPTSPPTPQPTTREFNDPRVRVAEGDLALDLCREWATNCGKPAADAFCVSKGLAGAVDFRVAADSPPTVVIGTKQICREPGCDRITWVNCSSSPNRIFSIDAQTLHNLQLMRLKGKQIP